MLTSLSNDVKYDENGNVVEVLQYMMLKLEWY